MRYGVVGVGVIELMGVYRCRPQGLAGDSNQSRIGWKANFMQVGRDCFHKMMVLGLWGLFFKG